MKQGRDYDASSGFPYCRYFLSGVSQEPLDNGPSDWRTYRFAIEIVQEMSAKTPSNAEADWQDAVEAVMNRLSAQWQLSANCDVSLMQISPVTYLQPPFGPAIALQLVYEVKTLIR